MNSLRRAFGFSPDTEDEEGNYDPTVPTYAVDDHDEPSAAPVVAATPPTPSAPDTREPSSPTADGATVGGDDDTTATLTDDLFDAVIELFNRTQPEFVRECLNLEAQRKYILNSLSTTLRQRIDAALSAENGQWKFEKEALEKQIAELKKSETEAENLRKEIRAMRQSADSKRRAMLDRINDLETQLTRHAQEKERYYARNKHTDPDELTKATTRVKELEAANESIKAESTANQAKIAELEAKTAEDEAKVTDYEAKLQESEAEKAKLETRIKELEAQAPAATDTAVSVIASAPVAEDVEALEVKIKEQEVKVKELEAAVESLAAEKTALSHNCAEKEAKCTRLQEEVGRQTTLKEQLEVKVAMSDTMINDLRNQAAAARNELDQMQREQDTVIGQIQEQLDSLEELKARKDAKISELQESNASLRHTIETNLYNQANSELKLRSEIKSLKAELSKYVPEATSEDSKPESKPQAKSDPAKPTESQPKRRGRPKKIRIDNDLVDAECFAGAEVKREDPDFGYHEPPHKPVNDNEAQLSLF